MGILNICYHCGSTKNIDENDICDNDECQDIWERYFKYDKHKGERNEI